MAIVFLNVNGTTNAVNYANYSPGFLNDISSFYTIADDSDFGVSDLLKDVTTHKYSDIKGTNPYITAHYDGTNITVTFANGTAPTILNFSLLGVTYYVTVSNNQALIPVSIHPAVNKQRINISFNVSGYPTSNIEIGGYGSPVTTQAYKDSNGVIQVVPLKSADLANYWTTSSMDTSWEIADLATVTGLTTHLLIHYVLPALNLSLTADEQNAVNDIKTNVLPNVVSTLSEILPISGTADIHYASYKAHLSQAKTAMTNYTTDRNKILQYTTLK